MQCSRLFGLALPLLIFAGCAAKAPSPASSAAYELDAACDTAQAKLQTVNEATFKRIQGQFDYRGQSFKGCILSVIGDKTTIIPDQYPEALFYPSEGSAQLRNGWRADDEADGPDGTAFRIMRSNVFCAVEGRWDGGDDSDPTYVPSTRVEFQVQCGNIKP